jgi:uncharacterized protein with HEPN domain
MRPDRLFLSDIVEAAGAIEDHIRGRDEESLLTDRTARAAVLHELTVIGEAASRVSSETRERHPEIPWTEIVAFRNVVIHEYFGLSWPIIWVTATEEVPDLRAKVQAILASEK